MDPTPRPRVSSWRRLRSHRRRRGGSGVRYPPFLVLRVYPCPCPCVWTRGGSSGTGETAGARRTGSVSSGHRYSSTSYRDGTGWDQTGVRWTVHPPEERGVGGDVVPTLPTLDPRVGPRGLVGTDHTLHVSPSPVPRLLYRRGTRVSLTLTVLGSGVQGPRRVGPHRPRVVLVRPRGSGRGGTEVPYDTG